MSSNNPTHSKTTWIRRESILQRLAPTSDLKAELQSSRTAAPPPAPKPAWHLNLTGRPKKNGMKWLWCMAYFVGVPRKFVNTSLSSNTGCYAVWWRQMSGRSDVGGILHTPPWDSWSFVNACESTGMSGYVMTIWNDLDSRPMLAVNGKGL